MEIDHNDAVPCGIDEEASVDLTATSESLFSYLPILNKSVEPDSDGPAIYNKPPQQEQNLKKGTDGSETKPGSQWRTSIENEHASAAKRPCFRQVYDEFEKKKSPIVMEAPPRDYLLPPFRPLEAPHSEVANKGEAFLGAINAFMYTYTPPVVSMPFAPADHWGKEARALTEEFERLKEQTTSSSIMWSSQERKTSNESGFGSEGTDEGKINDSKPSSGMTSPLLTLAESNVSSDNEEDQNQEIGFATLKENVLGPIGRPRFKLKGQCGRSSSIDSGYLSAADSNATFSGRRGSQSIVEIDDFWSDTSSRPTSPLLRRTKPLYGMEVISPIKLDPFAQPFPPVHSSQAVSEALQPQGTDISMLSSLDPNISTASSSSTRSRIDQANGSFPRHKNWITEDILEMIAVRDKLYKRTKSHPSPDIVNMYKKIRNMVVGMTRNAKRAYEKKLHDSMHKESSNCYSSYKSHQRSATYFQYR